MRRTRQKTLSLKITDDAESILLKLRLLLTAQRGEPVTKTDVIEAALFLLAKREKLSPK